MRIAKNNLDILIDKSKSIFYGKDKSKDITILKSNSSVSNKYEKNIITLTKDIYDGIKDKNITLIVTIDEHIEKKVKIKDLVLTTSVKKYSSNKSKIIYRVEYTVIVEEETITLSDNLNDLGLLDKKIENLYKKATTIRIKQSKLYKKYLFYKLKYISSYIKLLKEEIAETIRKVA